MNFPQDNALPGTAAKAIATLKPKNSIDRGRWLFLILMVLFLFAVGYRTVYSVAWNDIERTDFTVYRAARLASNFMIWLMLAAIYFGMRGRPVLGGVSLAAATLIKAFPIALLALYFIFTLWANLNKAMEYYRLLCWATMGIWFSSLVLAHRQVKIGPHESPVL